MVLRFAGAGRSDVGRVREQNEDSAFLGPYVALVADGVGGAAAGEIASATAAYVVSALAVRRFGDDPGAVLREAGACAQSSIHAGIVADDSRFGMATTLTALVGDGAGFWLGHVGDSRAYLFRDGALSQLSEDHTYVQHLVERGQLTSEEATVHQWRNVVVRSLDGVTPDVEEGPVLDIVPLELREGDRVLLCSDGLSDMVHAAQLRELLGTEAAEDAAEGLLQAALAAGGRDNVTCLVVDVVDGPQVTAEGRVLGALADPDNVAEPTDARR